MFFIEKRDEFASDDASGGVGGRGFISLLVGDAETYHAWVAQVHRFDTAEVGLFLLIEIFLCSGSGGGRYHVNESFGMSVDFADALFAGFGSDEHDDAHAISFGYGTVFFDVVFKWEVGDDEAIDAVCLAGLT